MEWTCYSKASKRGEFCKFQFFLLVNNLGQWNIWRAFRLSVQPPSEDDSSSEHSIMSKVIRNGNSLFIWQGKEVKFLPFSNCKFVRFGAASPPSGKDIKLGHHRSSRNLEIEDIEHAPQKQQEIVDFDIFGYQGGPSLETYPLWKTSGNCHCNFTLLVGASDRPLLISNLNVNCELSN